MLKNLKISSRKLIFILSLYFGFVLNITFLKTVYLNFSINNITQFLCIFFLTLLIPLPIFIFFNIILTKHTIKTLSCILLIISSFTNYMMLEFGVHINRNMIRSVFLTDLREASELLSMSVLINILIWGVIPAILICATKIEFDNFKTECYKRGRLIIASLLTMLIYLVLFAGQLIPFGRNHSEIKSQYNTLNYVFNTIMHIRKTFKTPKNFLILDENPISKISKDKIHVFTLVIGETARSQNFSLYGYEKETNPLLKNEGNLLVIPNATSCGTDTAYSVPCMFSHKGRSEINTDNAKYEENLLDILKKAGFDVIWVDNDMGCKNICNRIQLYDVVNIGNNEKCFGDYCQDDAVLDHFKSLLNKITQNTVIVLHTMGSHGPAYFKRYSKEFEKFKPTCDTVNIQDCTREELVNSYDNTILYTDHIISTAINYLKSYKQFETSLIYISDHGESLAENGLYLHGVPYTIAPKEQTSIPFFMWFSENSLKNSNIDFECLKNKNWQNISHDNFFHSVMGLTETESKLYDKNLDMLLDCRK